MDAWDLEINLKDYGWTEIIGINDRGAYDLRNEKLERIPHILEIAIGIDRLIYALLDVLYFDCKEKSGEKSILKLPYFLSPIKIAILPLVKK